MGWQARLNRFCLAIGSCNAVFQTLFLFKTLLLSVQLSFWSRWQNLVDVWNPDGWTRHFLTKMTRWLQQQSAFEIQGQMSAPLQHNQQSRGINRTQLTKVMMDGGLWCRGGWPHDNPIIAILRLRVIHRTGQQCSLLRLSTHAFAGEIIHQIEKHFKKSLEHDDQIRRSFFQLLNSQRWQVGVGIRYSSFTISCNGDATL